MTGRDRCGLRALLILYPSMCVGMGRGEQHGTQVVLAFPSISFHSCKVGLVCSCRPACSWSKAGAEEHLGEVAVKSPVPSRLPHNSQPCHHGTREALPLSPQDVTNAPDLDKQCWLWDLQTPSPRGPPELQPTAAHITGAPWPGHLPSSTSDRLTRGTVEWLKA